jgi:hypothetical protein
MGFTTEAIAAAPHLIHENQNRAWDAWDAPDEEATSPIAALQVVFAASELAVSPEHRKSSGWDEVVFFNAAPPGKLKLATLFVTCTDAPVRQETEAFGIWSLGNNRYAQLVFHDEPDEGFPEFIASSVGAARSKPFNGIDVPPSGYFYFLARRENGVRYLFGAKAASA